MFIIHLQGVLTVYYTPTWCHERMQTHPCCLGDSVQWRQNQANNHTCAQTKITEGKKQECTLLSRFSPYEQYRVYLMPISRYARPLDPSRNSSWHLGKWKLYGFILPWLRGSAGRQELLLPGISPLLYPRLLTHSW